MAQPSSQEPEARPGFPPTGATEVLTPSIPRDIAARSQRERILRAMAVSCSEKTFALTTIGDIVANASISRATFYKHFANKRECFAATVESFVSGLRSAVTEARGVDDDSPAEEVRAGLAALLERLATSPTQAWVLIVEAPSVDPQIVRDYRRLAVDSLAATMLGAEQGRRGGADPELAFGRAKVLVADRIAAGETGSLPALLPELFYLALLPYVGHEAALKQAQLVP